MFTAITGDINTGIGTALHRIKKSRIEFGIFFQQSGIAFADFPDAALGGVDIPEFGTFQTVENSGTEFGMQTYSRFTVGSMGKGVAFVKKRRNNCTEVLAVHLGTEYGVSEFPGGFFNIVRVIHTHHERLTFGSKFPGDIKVVIVFTAGAAGSSGDGGIDRIDSFADIFTDIGDAFAAQDLIVEINLIGIL